jgi:hypothetical protein
LGPQFERTGAYRYTNRNWENFNDKNNPELNGIYDINSVAVHPRNKSAYFGSLMSGIIRITADDSIQITDALTPGTTLNYAAGNNGVTRVAGLAFDEDENLWMTNNLTESGIEEFKSYLFPLLFGMFKYNTEEEITKVVNDFFSFKIDRREFHCRLAFFAADSYCNNGSGGSFEKILFFNKWKPWETIFFIKENDKFFNEENISRFLSTEWDINLNFTKENGNIEVVDANGGK